MKTCPKCGVENIQTAASCYRCASPLEGPESLLGVHADIPFGDKLPATVIISGQEPEHQQGPSSSYGGHVICPNCEVGNEPDWLFCQECGMRLPRPQQAAPDAPTHRAEAPPVREPARVADPPARQPARRDPDRTPFKQKAPQSFNTKSEEIDQVPAAPPPVYNQAYNQEVDKRPPPEAPAPPPASSEPAQKSERKRMTTNIVCVTCGTIQSGTGFFCTTCGAKLSSMAMQRIKERDAAKPEPSLRPIPNLRLVTEGGENGAAYPLDRSKVTIGRSRADITFPHDGFMSGLHARIVERDGRYYLVDENSRNGTFLRINGEIVLKPGDMIIVGKQVFKFEKR
jgi:hypothetical protein